MLNKFLKIILFILFLLFFSLIFVLKTPQINEKPFIINPPEKKTDNKISTTSSILEKEYISSSSQIIKQILDKKPPEPKLKPKTKENDDKIEKEQYKTVRASFFWIGEKANLSNDYIHNKDSAWDSLWLEHYGGIDKMKNRCGYYPCSFIPKENPFYFALPYNDLKENGERKESAKKITWYEKEKNKKSILKNKWIEIIYKNKKCFAQWEDVGPNNEDDFSYVFGNSLPQNTFGIKAGIDISPALKTCLEMKDNDYVSWRFVDDEEVENGPWKKIIVKRDAFQY